MIAVILTLETERTLRAIEAARAALVAGGVPVRVCHAGSTLDLATALMTGRDLRTVAVVSEVDAAMDAILSRLDRPFILLHSDPLAPAAARHLGSGGEHLASSGEALAALVQGIRDTMRQLSSFVAPQARPGCLTIDAARTDAPSRLLDALLDVLACRAMWTAQPLPALPALSGTEMGEASEAALMVKGALSAFQEMQAGGLPARFVISRLLFCEAKQEGAPIAAPLDISGGRQLLVFGPYIHLPGGIWHVRLVLEFSPDILDVPFLVDVAGQYGAEIRARTSFTVNVPGRHEIAFDFLHERPTMPIEFRIFSERAVEAGRMALGFADVQRHVAATVDVEGVHEAMRRQVVE